MNRIVRERYPVSSLPEDLRKEFPDQDEVTVTVVGRWTASEDQGAESPSGTGHFSRFRHLARNNFNSTEDIVAHVRALRDEWDDRDRLNQPDP